MAAGRSTSAPSQQGSSDCLGPKSEKDNVQKLRRNDPVASLAWLDHASGQGAVLMHPPSPPGEDSTAAYLCGKILLEHILWGTFTP